MQKHVNLVDLVKSFPTNIFLQNLASIQKRTSPLKFAHLAEKSEKGSISNLSTKAEEEEADRAAHATPSTACTNADVAGPFASFRKVNEDVDGLIQSDAAAPRSWVDVAARGWEC